MRFNTQSYQSYMFTSAVFRLPLYHQTTRQCCLQFSELNLLVTCATFTLSVYNKTINHCWLLTSHNSMWVTCAVFRLPLFHRTTPQYYVQFSCQTTTWRPCRLKYRASDYRCPFSESNEKVPRSITVCVSVRCLRMYIHMSVHNTAGWRAEAVVEERIWSFLYTCVCAHMYVHMFVPIR